MIDGAPLTKPIELPKRTAMNKGTNGTKVPLDDDALITNMLPPTTPCIVNVIT